MKIAVDAMWGDFAPQDIVKGSVMGAREYGVGIILVGPEERIKQELVQQDTSGLDIEIVHTDEYLVEGEAPAYALRTKRKASIALTVKQVRDGKAQAAIGVGATGGVVAAALAYLGTIEGISRPVIGGQFLMFAPHMVTMDLGGNVDCRPDQLLDFAIVGTVYARKVLGIEYPTVGLVSVGAEEGKGNAQVKEAYPLLKASGLNFIGNLEGNDVALGKANVVICDGFIGNVMAKYSEGLGTVISNWLKTELKGKLSEEELDNLAKNLLNNMVPADSNGGGPLWAINGVVLKAHGRSRYPEVAATIGTAKKAVETDIIGALKEELLKVKGQISIQKD